VATGVYPCCSPQANFSKWQSNLTLVVVGLNKLQKQQQRQEEEEEELIWMSN